MSASLHSLSVNIGIDNALVLAKLEMMGGSGGASQGLQVRF
jgi:hypothetical protein